MRRRIYKGAGCAAVVLASNVAFLDPADSVLDELQPHTTQGGGHTHCIATESPALSLDAFNSALQALGTPLRATLVHLE